MLAAAILVALVQSISLSTLFEVTALADSNYLLAALFLLIFNIFIQMLKWWYLLRIANAKVTLITAWRSLLIGFPLGFVTPGRLGEIGRAFYVKELSQTRTFSLVVIDKITTVLVVLTLGLVGLLGLPNTGLSPKLQSGLIICLCLFLCFLTFSLVSPRISQVCRRFTKSPQFKQKHLAIALVLSGFFYITFVIQFVLLVRAFDATVGFMTSTQAAASVFLLKTVLPVAFGDLGIREGAAVFFFERNGVSAAHAFQASFLLFLINVGIPALLGLPMLLKTRAEQPR